VANFISDQASLIRYCTTMIEEYHLFYIIGSNFINTLANEPECSKSIE
jgi:hypothetical protein